jgi:hypothetical protein
MLGPAGAGTGRTMPALCTVDLVSVVMSNQIQPPVLELGQFDLELGAGRRRCRR